MITADGKVGAFDAGNRHRTHLGTRAADIVHRDRGRQGGRPQQLGAEVDDRRADGDREQGPGASEADGLRIGAAVVGDGELSWQWTGRRRHEADADGTGPPHGNRRPSTAIGGQRVVGTHGHADVAERIRPDTRQGHGLRRTRGRYPYFAECQCRRAQASVGPAQPGAGDQRAVRRSRGVVADRKGGVRGTEHHGIEDDVDPAGETRSHGHAGATIGGDPIVAGVVEAGRRNVQVAGADVRHAQGLPQARNQLDLRRKGQQGRCHVRGWRRRLGQRSDRPASRVGPRRRAGDALEGEGHLLQRPERAVHVGGEVVRGLVDRDAGAAVVGQHQLDRRHRGVSVVRDGPVHPLNSVRPGRH